METSKGLTATAPGLWPIDHWDDRTPAAASLIDPVTGKVSAAQVIDLGVEWVDTSTGPRSAHRFSYRGDYEADVWYDDAGRWVRLRIPGWDGSYADYVCRICGR